MSVPRRDDDVPRRDDDVPRRQDDVPRRDEICTPPLVSVPRRDLIVPRRVPRRDEEFEINTSSNQVGIKLERSGKREQKRSAKMTIAMEKARIKRNPSETESEDSE